MSRNIKLYLNDILTSISKIKRFTVGLDQNQFFDNELVFDGVTLNLQIIGESAKNIPSTIRAKYSQIDWKSIIGLRNIIAHTYFSLDPEIIWDIIQTELEPLKIVIELIQANENAD